MKRRDYLLNKRSKFKLLRHLIDSAQNLIHNNTKNNKYTTNQNANPFMQIISGTTLTRIRY